MDVTALNADVNTISVSLANQISAMLGFWDKNLVCRFANSAYLDWFGKTQDEMINKITMRELLGPELFEKNLPYINGVLAGTVQTFEREIMTPDGEIKQTIANYFPNIEDGEINGFFVHVADITPVKQLESKLLKSNSIVNEQNKLLLNFANTVSHNLKSYSGNINTILDILENPASEEERVMMMGYLRKLSNNFTETINNLNEITRVQNQGKLKPDVINLHNFINRAIDILRIQIVNTAAVVRNNVSPAIILTANPAYLESILLNLLSNALKYHHPERAAVVEIDAVQENNSLKLSIKDNGRGINMKKYGAKLFGLYQTFHKNTDAQGVGLFLVKFQVESMGGTIEVDSEEGSGTTFSVYF